jgi:hypothetical protein
LLPEKYSNHPGESTTFISDLLPRVERRYRFLLAFRALPGWGEQGSGQLCCHTQARTSFARPLRQADGALPLSILNRVPALLPELIRSAENAEKVTFIPVAFYGSRQIFYHRLYSFVSLRARSV